MAKLTYLTAAQTTKPEPSLLNLPGELRNQIYSHVFANIEEKIVLPINPHKPKLLDRLKRKLTHRSKRGPYLALLATCHQIHSEAFGYVHGIVHASLHISETAPWLNRNLIREKLVPKLHKGLRVLSSNLASVTHLDLHGWHALRVLAHPQGKRFVLHDVGKLTRVERGYLVGDALDQVRRRLGGVRIITMRSDFRRVGPGVAISPHV